MAFVEHNKTDIVQRDASLRKAKSSFSGVATTMSFFLIASSSKSLVPMLPYKVDIDFPSERNVRCKPTSVCADNARRGVTKTTRFPAARQRKIASSAILVFPALVGSDTTKSSCRFTARDAASSWDGHNSISDFFRRYNREINNWRSRHHSVSPSWPDGALGSRTWKLAAHRSPIRWIARR